MNEGASAHRGRADAGAATFEPIIVNRASAGTRFPLKVAALNLRGGGRLDAVLARLKRPPLEDADVILLCEAGWRQRASRGREVAAELAAALNMSFVFEPLFGILNGAQPITAFNGAAILCREPLVNVATPPLPLSERLGRRRNRISRPAGIVASAVIGGRAITIGVAHLDRNGPPRFREGQMAQYLAAIPGDAPAVIGGDFNTTTIDWPDDGRALLNVARLMIVEPRRFRDPIRYEPLFERLMDAGFEIEGTNLPLRPTFTFSRFIPRAMRPKLDWIAIRGMRAVPGSAAVIAPRASILAPRASDHDLIVCSVTL